MVEQFRKSGWDFGALVATVLRSNLFFDLQAYRTKVKSPVEFAVGIVRGLGGKVDSSTLAQRLEGLGQSLFHPPSVKGWDGGQAWLNAQTLLFRQNLALALTSTEDERFGHAAARPGRAGSQDNRQRRRWRRGLLPRAVPARRRAGRRPRTAARLPAPARKPAASAYGPRRSPSQTTAVRAVCHLVLTLPEFQLN